MQSPPPFFFSFGIPRPKMCRLPSGAGGAGQVRECVSDKGTIRQRILEWEDARRLCFEMTDTEMSFHRYVHKLVDSFDLEAVSAARTRVTRTTEVDLAGRFQAFRAIGLYLGLKAVHRYVFKNWALLAREA